MRGVIRIGLLLAGLGLFIGLAGTILFLRRAGAPRSLPLAEAPIRVTADPVSYPGGGALRDHRRVIDWSVRFRVGHDRWDFRHWLGTDGSYIEGTCLEILKNGKRVRRIRGGELSRCVVAVRRIRTPAPFPVIAVRGHSSAGHGQATEYLGIRRGRLIAMGRDPGGECGGPVFHDLDGDRRPEWVFDDYDWYTYYGNGPRYLVVYRLTSSARLKVWKRLPNHGRRFLPDTTGMDTHG